MSGGWLLLEEDDHRPKLSIGVNEPSIAEVAIVARVSIDVARKRGLVDFYFGRRVRGLVEQLGFTDVGHEGWTDIIRRYLYVPYRLSDSEFTMQTFT